MLSPFHRWRCQKSFHHYTIVFITSKRTERQKGQGQANLAYEPQRKFQKHERSNTVRTYGLEGDKFDLLPEDDTFQKNIEGGLIVTQVGLTVGKALENLAKSMRSEAGRENEEDWEREGSKVIGMKPSSLQSQGERSMTMHAQIDRL